MSDGNSTDLDEFKAFFNKMNIEYEVCKTSNNGIVLEVRYNNAIFFFAENGKFTD